MKLPLLIVLFWIAASKNEPRLVVHSGLLTSASTTQPSAPSKTCHVLSDGEQTCCPTATPPGSQEQYYADTDEQEEGELKRDLAPDVDDTPGKRSSINENEQPFSYHHYHDPELL